MASKLNNSKLIIFDKYAAKIENFSGKLSSVDSVVSNVNKAVYYIENHLPQLFYVGEALINLLPEDIININKYEEHVPVHLVTIAGIAIAAAPYVKEAAMVTRTFIFSAKISKTVSKQDLTTLEIKQELKDCDYLKILSYTGYASSYGELLSRVTYNMANYFAQDPNNNISTTLSATNYIFNKLKYVGTISTIASTASKAKNMFKTCKTITNIALKNKVLLTTYMLQDSIPKDQLATQPQQYNLDDFPAVKCLRN